MVEPRWHQGGRGAPEAEAHEVPSCWGDRLLSQTEPKNNAAVGQCNKANSFFRAAAYYSILYQLPGRLFDCHLPTGFNPITKRQPFIRHGRHLQKPDRNIPHGC